MTAERPDVGTDPRSVPGYDRAVELGLTPRVPPGPPVPVTVSSTRVLLAIAGVFLATVVTLLLVVDRVELPGWAYGVIAATGLAASAFLLAVHRRVSWQEMSAGYCRMDTMVALFSRDPENRFPASRMKGAPWDLRGLWRLAEDGSVVREPVDGVLPPGRYPSPNRPGELELWTGEAWAYLYQRPERPFLDRPPAR